MARRRMIAPEIWQSEDFGELSVLARIVFIGLFSMADDEGKGRAKAIYVKSILFPYDENIRVADIDKTLEEIGSKMSVTFFIHNENKYYRLDNWKKWQSIDKPQPSKIPDPIFAENVKNACPNSVDIGQTNTPETIENASSLDAPKPVKERKNLLEQRFSMFWGAYPRRVGKGAAEKVFTKINPSEELTKRMLSAIEQAKQSQQWKNENGRYIPNPATWLGQKRWEDELGQKADKTTIVSKPQRIIANEKGEIW